MSAGLNPSMSSIQFDANPANTIVGKMRSVDTSFQEGPAPAAQAQFTRVRPYSAQTNSTPGNMMTWDQAPGQIGSFYQDRSSGPTPPPESIRG